VAVRVVPHAWDGAAVEVSPAFSVTMLQHWHYHGRLLPALSALLPAGSLPSGCNATPRMGCRCRVLWPMDRREDGRTHLPFDGRFLRCPAETTARKNRKYLIAFDDGDTRWTRLHHLQWELLEY
jgi:hypothetical protein